MAGLQSNAIITDESFYSWCIKTTEKLNRNGLQQEFEWATEKCSSEGSAVVLLSIDLGGLKGINDTLGHDAGDALLQVVGKRLAGDAGFGARLGGDEFALIYTCPSDVEAEDEKPNALLACLAQPLIYRGKAFRPSASIGTASFPASTETESFKHADLALYTAKRAGGNKVVSYEHRMTKAIGVI